MSNQNEIDENTPSVEIRRDRGISPLWLLPLLAFSLAGWLVYKALNEAGQRVQIYFEDAQGLVAGRTTIRYQGLEVGMVRDITLSKDLSNIYVDADIYPEAAQILNAGTRFWLVKPKASLTGISGLDALVSGNYIAIQPGEGEPETKFIALDGPPADTPAQEGLTVSLRSDDLGSVSVGSTIIYKKIPIGEVYNYELDDKNDSVIIHTLIQEKYAHLITTQSRFWNVSGIGANIGFNGLDVQFESLSALLGGAIAVDSPDAGEAVSNNQEFKLYPNVKTAGRGIPIKIFLPDNNQISPGGAPIMYRGLEVGQITDLELSDERDQIIAYASIEPSFSDMLNMGSRFVLEEAKVSLAGIENVSNLVRGNFLTLVPGTGDKSRTFTAIRNDDLEREKPGTLLVSLVADASFGLTPGTNVLYRGIAVGSITRVALHKEKVHFDVLISPEYKDLIKSNNRFFVTGSAKAEFTGAGLNVTIPPAKQLLTGSISFTSEGEKKPQPSYTLFQTQSLAELAELKATGSKTISLLAPELPAVNNGSPLLYRNLPVGIVESYSLTQSGMMIKVKVKNQYAHLIRPNTVFWNHSGIEIDASLSGLSVKSQPLSSLIKGGIAFDQIEGVENRIGKRWKLYSSMKEAQQFGKLITLKAAGESAIAKGMAIKYQGIKIGEVTRVMPNFKTGILEAQARLFPEYAPEVARNGSHFWLVTPQITTSGAKNLDSLLGSYVRVTPGSGKKQSIFPLNTQPRTENKSTFILESEHRASVAVGTPILYRDIEVGQVSHIELGNLSDRVLITFYMNDDYAYLVRKNTIFWNVSGVNVAIGITGATVQAGTMDSILRGGIAFATPNTQPLLSKAEIGDNFLLHAKPEAEWKDWRTAIPNPNKE